MNSKYLWKIELPSICFACHEVLVMRESNLPDDKAPIWVHYMDTTMPVHERQFVMTVADLTALRCMATQPSILTIEGNIRIRKRRIAWTFVCHARADKIILRTFEEMPVESLVGQTVEVFRIRCRGRGSGSV